ncbi:MAG: HD domain-containing protein [Candidatus Sericytochromatia bacterium]|nr:HD domain-containing protein [Candidatus Sericytochromatia bacterium]
MSAKGGDALFSLKNEPWIQPMIGSTQNPEWHQERPLDDRLPMPGTNDVFNHTWLVMHYSDRLAQRFRLTAGDRQSLLMAALFHDVGKPATRRVGCRGDGVTRCKELYRSDAAAAEHARKSGHRYDPTFIRNLGHEFVSADAARHLLAGLPDVETVTAIITDHIVIGQAWQPETPERVIREIQTRCQRADLLVLHYWADKAGGMPVPFPAGLDAPGLPQRIEGLHGRFDAGCTVRR